MSFRPNDTQHFKRIAKVRSRHMIPMEMLAFLTLLVAGWAGAFGPGYLHRVLAQDDQALWWGFALMPVAGVGFAVATAEWWIGSDWENGILRMSIGARMWLSFLAFIMWMWVLYVMAVLTDRAVTSMVITACFVSPFHLWSWWANMRVLTALNPKLKTDKLTRDLEANRHRF